MSYMDEPTAQVNATGSEAVAQALARARMLMQVDKDAHALLEIRGVLARDAECLDAQFLAGLCLVHLAQYQEAGEAARAVIRLNPLFAPGYWLKAQVALHQSKYRDGLSAIATALELDPDEPDFHALHAALLLDSHKPAAALQATDAALAEDPEHVQARHIRALALVALGRRSEADAETLDNLRRDADDANNWFIRGTQQWTAGDADAAKASCLEALRIDPEHEGAQEGLARALAVRHPFFALLYRWTIFMYRLPQRTRYVVIFGMWFLMQVVKNLSKLSPALTPVIAVVTVIYLLFCIYTWVAPWLFTTAIRRGWIR